MMAADRCGTPRDAVLHSDRSIHAEVVTTRRAPSPARRAFAGSPMADCPPTCLAAARFPFKTSSRDASARLFPLGYTRSLAQPPIDGTVGAVGRGEGGRCELNEKRASAEPRCPSRVQICSMGHGGGGGPLEGDAQHCPRGERVSVRPADQLGTWARRCGQGEGAERRSLRTTPSPPGKAPRPRARPGAGINGTQSPSGSGDQREPRPCPGAASTRSCPCPGAARAEPRRHPAHTGFCPRPE
jgi:hypothetical protein